MSATLCKLVLVRETDSPSHGYSEKGKVANEKCAGTWNLAKVIEEGLSLDPVMGERHLHSRRIATNAIRRFYARRIDLVHPVVEKFSQDARLADFCLMKPPNRTSS